MKRQIAILGSTGSIGTQALDVIRQHPDLFDVVLISANNSAELLISQAIEFNPDNVVICNPDKYDTVAEALQPRDIKVWTGIDSLCSLVSADNVDIVVGAMVGFSGLRPTLSAINAGKIIALANKETLVAAGSIVTEQARRHNAVILPVDSEHSAIFQCLLSAQGNAVTRLHLTASGGPFRKMAKSEIASMTKDRALKHPNWNMGAKVTIDSSTMMNKGFEVIEAKWLFDMQPQDINVLVHPESIVHSMIEFEDGAVIAQMGCPDMRQPIGFALAFPDRITVGNKRLNLAETGSLTFEKPDTERFPCLGLSYEAIKRGGNVPCAMNAANEVAVAAFLRDKISFYGIADLIDKCINGVDFVANPTIEDIFETDRLTAVRAKEILGI